MIEKIKQNKTIKDLYKEPLGNTNIDTNTLLFYLNYNYNKNQIIVTKSTEEAYDYYHNLKKYIKEDDLYLFLEENTIKSEYTNTSDFIYDRIRLMSDALTKDNTKIVIANFVAFYQKRVKKEIYKNYLLEIKKDTDIRQEQLIKLLEEMSYQKNYLIEKTNEYARRGDIVDIFPLFSVYPVRIIYDFDKIDKIFYFDINTNLKIQEITSFRLVPTNDIIYKDDVINTAIKNLELEEDTKRIIHSLKTREQNSVLNKYISFIYSDTDNICDYLDSLIYFIEEDEIRLLKEINSKEDIRLNYYKDVTKPHINLSGKKQLNNLNTHPLSRFYSHQDNIINHLIANNKQQKLTILSIQNKTYIKHLEVELSLHNIYCGGNIIITTEVLPPINLDEIEIITYECLMDKDEIIKKKNKFKSYISKSTKIKSEEDLTEGDYVVHYDYGIGKYLGIKTLNKDGIEKDYLYIEYKGSDHLYVPIDKINKIAKYRDHFFNIELSELNPKKWKNTKEKAKKRIKDISNELIALYAKRKSEKGFAFEKDDEESINFLNDFKHEHTIDQLKAIEEIKHDMEESYPMERLLIGDVGYGKTEVALNAVFKAVKSLKQVAVLAPTTILVNQHYKTFEERLRPYNISVSFLNRFTKNTKEEIEKIKDGKTDVVIGTHRLLSRDIEFNDLGLLIIDEEQRFGVTHKERIKEMKTNVDSLSMSATPIPRTLEMSLSKIKDLSIIKTPPKNRYQVETHVLKRTDQVIKEAIERELDRNGQVFYLYNHIETIEEMELKLKTLIPRAKIEVIHGKLTSKQLEERINNFINQETNILLCTTIIETGIDMPNANTLIIHDADTLGLSQLYQLRGRVGRSNRHAYSYMLYSPSKNLTDDAYKRLKAIEEYQSLGSGYKIAYMDLTIRGGGNILGQEQSGFIDDIGVDMYLKLLDEELNHKELYEDTFKFLNVSFSSNYISKDYIEEAYLRIDYHKRILRIRTTKEKEELIKELEDIYGPVPQELLIYINEVLFKHLLEDFNFIKYEDTVQKDIFIMSEEMSSKIKGEVFVMFQENFSNLEMTYRKPHIRLNYKKIKDKNKMFLDVINYLELIKKEKWYE